MGEVRLSELAKDIEDRPRWRREVDITGFYGHTGDRLPKVLVQINTKSEDIDAIVAAHEAVTREAERARDGKDAAKSDEDLTLDLKTIEALWRAYRDANDPECPAFPSPEWMKARLDTDQIAYLLNVYTACRRD